MDKFVEKLEKAMHFLKRYVDAIVASIAWAVIALLPSFLTGDLYSRLKQKWEGVKKYGYYN